MGQLFELIADEALEKLDEYYKQCHVCSASAVDLFVYHGRLHLENGAVEDDIYAVCANCIVTKKLSHAGDSEFMKSIENYFAASNLTLEERQSRIQLLIEKYQKTPNIPSFMQGEDRPLCCNDIAEFVGYPRDKESLYQITENAIYWEHQIKEKRERYNFRKYGLPESFKEVASFRCSHCGTLYYTFQFS